jgi:hypothetical protein
MKFLSTTVLPIFLATLWISLSEFVRNEFLAKSYWTEHYNELGLTFPSEPVNGMIWGLWSLCMAIFLYVMRERFSFVESLAIGWWAGFMLMWIVTYNMMVFPLGILIYALPLSVLEVALALWIMDRFRP